jgi:hypothetical protein
MALSKNVELVNNFQEKSVFKSCYITVNFLSGNKNRIIFQVLWQKEQDGIELQKKEYAFTPSMNEDNFIKQAYEYLKTLPEFADAIDC